MPTFDSQFRRVLGGARLGVAKYLSPATNGRILSFNPRYPGRWVILTRRSSSDLAYALIAGASGLAIGWLDLHTTEVITTIVPLVVVGLILGALQPKAAWRWAALIALGQPLMAGVTKLTGMATAEPVHLDPRITLVVLAFALLGAYGGALVRRAARALAGGGTTPRF